MFQRLHTALIKMFNKISWKPEKYVVAFMFKHLL